jgi:pimeloyl-ACP methyl ester carboxylesterase
MAKDIRFSVRDGARLHGRIYAVTGTGQKPLLCLSGLAGNGAQFAALARSLSVAGPNGRDVLTMDFRGRGRSRQSVSGQPASLIGDCEDVLDFLTVAGVKSAALLGTGYGGQVAMLVALLRPAAVSAIILNDSGPVLEPSAVVRLIGQLVSQPAPASWPDATRLLKRMYGTHYPQVQDGEWLELAREQFPEVDGRPGAACDRGIADSYSLSRRSAQRVSLWEQFAAVGHIPLLLLLAANSDMLSKETVARMRSMHPAMDVATVTGEGHPPLLRDPPTIKLIADFLQRTLSKSTRQEPELKAVA